MTISLINCSKAQFPVIDSIKKKIASAGNVREELKQIQQLLLLRNSLNGDSMIWYAGKGKMLALQLSDASALGWCEYYLLAGELAKGKTDSVIFKIENGPLQKTNFKKERALYFKTALLKANVLNRLDERVKALELQLQLLDEAERENNIQAQAFILNYIGATYLNISKQEDAKSNWMKGLALIENYPSFELKEIQAVISSNLALYYYNQLQVGGKTAADSFMLYATVTETVCRKYGIYSTLAAMLAITGNYYASRGDFINGEKKLTEAVDIRNKIGDPLYIMNDMTNLASFYYYQKNYDKCIALTKNMLRVAAENRISADKKQLLALMSAAYKGKGDFKKYSEALERYILFSDSTAEINDAEMIAEVEQRFKVQRNEVLIANQQLQLLRKNILIGSGSVMALIAAIIVFILFKRYRTKEKIKSQLALDEEKLKKDIAVKEAEENERKRIAAELHDNMGVQANSILHNTTLLSNQSGDNRNLISNLRFTALEMMSNLRETVWALKLNETGCVDTWHRILGFIKQMQRNYTGIVFEITGSQPEPAVLPSIRALHIIMVVKESVNNAVKHSGGSIIRISGSMEPAYWNIRISDNGNGFQISDKDFTVTNGLQNIQARAAAGNFLVLIDAAEGKGTTISIQVPR